MLIDRLDKFELAVRELSREVREHRAKYCALVTGIVAMAQRERLAKNYVMSDQLRAILKQSGVTVIQGTAGYSHGQIPDALRGRQVNDTWREVD